MKRYSSQLIAVLLLAIASSMVVVEAFTPSVVPVRPTSSLATTFALSAVADEKESAFEPLKGDDDDDDDEDVLDKVEMLGKGAAKVG